MERSASFGEWVRMRRTALHLTQDELARRVYCSAIMIRKIEADARRPSPEIAERLAAQLQLPAGFQPRFVKIARGELSADQLPPLHTQPAAPPPAWPDAQHRSHPGAPATSFVGRMRDLAQVCDEVVRPGTRLLTLLGPPGIGKTRLALHVAGELQGAFLHGVTYVPLAPVRDADLVVDAIAQVFGFAESAFDAPFDFLCAELHGKHLLLVVDNFEQVLPAARHLAALVEQAPRLTILATSRTPLNLTCERLWPVPSLSLPAGGRIPPAEAAIQYAAVQLFVTRARDVDPTFRLTAENTPAVVGICARLDGLPLAIELAAARVRLLSPDALLARLGDRLDLLASTAADRPERHHTLHSAISWSVELLAPTVQAVYRRLGVFLHGATLAAAQVVCGIDGAHGHALLEHLQVLVDQSLLRAERDAGGETRFTMLETIRDFALEQLALRGESSAVRQAHAGYFLHFVEANRLRLHGMERRTWLTRYERDYDNIRAALGWAQASGDGATLSRLAASLGWFWELHGRRTEARTWLHAALAVPATQMPSGARVAILHMLGHIANEEGDYERSRRLGSESLALAEALGDRWTAALCRRDLGWIYYVVDNDAAKAVDTGVAAASALEAAGDLRNHILAVLDVAIVHRLAGNPAAAVTYAEDALAKAREWDDAASAQEALATLAQIAHTQGDFDRALPLMEECLIAAAGYPNGKLIAWAHYHFAVMLLDSGNPQAAAEQYAASAHLWQERGEALAVAYCQSGQANCLLRQGLVARARAIYHATLASYHLYDAQRAAAWTQWNLAYVAAHAGDAAEVEALLHAGRDSFLSRNDTRGVDACEAALAGVWAPVREPIRL